MEGTRDGRKSLIRDEGEEEGRDEGLGKGAREEQGMTGSSGTSG